MKILIVDDEAYLREELIDALERVIPTNEYFEAEGYDDAIDLLKNNKFDIAFLDICLNGKDGLSIAEKAKFISPETNIVMVTAYSEYALEAFKLFVSGYILKPVNDFELREVIKNLRTPVEKDKTDKLEVRCFGNFEVFSKGKPFKFKRSKEKEVLAYLICLKGASASRNEICANVFEDASSTEKANNNFKQAYASLKKDLISKGFENVLVHSSNNSYAIDTEAINCDYYDYITGKNTSENTYRGEFMNQYSWAEQYIYSLENY